MPYYLKKLGKGAIAHKPGFVARPCASADQALLASSLKSLSRARGLSSRDITVMQCRRQRKGKISKFFVSVKHKSQHYEHILFNAPQSPRA